MWLANYRHGGAKMTSLANAASSARSTRGTGGRTTAPPVTGVEMNEPVWPDTQEESESNRAFITHRMGEHPSNVVHEWGHRGRGANLLISLSQRLDAVDNTVGFADGHVILRPKGEIKKRAEVGMHTFWY